MQVLKSVAVFGVYLGVAEYGLAHHIVESRYVALFWAPSGLAIAVLLAWGRWMVAPILLASFTVNYDVGNAAIPAAAIAFGNVGEYLIASEGIRRYSLRGVRLARQIAYAILASAAGITVAATIGSSVVADGAWVVWWGWWVGDALGIALFAIPFYFLLRKVNGSG